MKIALLTIDYPPMRGGVARYLSAMAAYFGSQMEVKFSPDLVRGKSWPCWWPAVLAARELGTRSDVIVTSHVLPIGTAAWIAKHKTGTPYVVIVHGMDVALAKRSWLKRWIATIVLRGAKLVVTNSKALEREMREEFGVKETVVVYPCVDGREGSEGRRVGEPRQARLLTVSRLVPRKGHLRVLDALDKIKRDGRIGSMRYTIVGDGPMRGEIEQRIRELGLDEFVTLVTDADDEALSKLYDQSDLFVMPTVTDPVDREGFGMVYLEAAAHGMPSIATRQPGVDEAVLDEITGLLVPDGDAKALASEVLRLVENVELRVRLGEAAKQRVHEEFTPEKQFGKLRDALESLSR